MESTLGHVEKGVMTPTPNRPERLNSFNDEMHAQLAECLKQVERDDTIRCLATYRCRARILCWSGSNDRNVDPTGRTDLGMSVDLSITHWYVAWQKLPKPVICAVNGVAAGQAQHWHWGATSLLLPVQQQIRQGV